MNIAYDSGEGRQATAALAAFPGENPGHWLRHQPPGDRPQPVCEAAAPGLEAAELGGVRHSLEKPLLTGLVGLVLGQGVVDIPGPVAGVAETADHVVAVGHGCLLPTMMRAFPPGSVTCSIEAGLTWEYVRYGP